MSKNIAIRIHEFTAYVPQAKDPKSPYHMSRGEVSFEAGDDEKLLEVAVSATPDSRHVQLENVETGEVENVRCGFYVFQAVLAREVDEPVAQVPMEDTAQRAIVLPDAPNRAQRRAGKKG